MNWTLALPSLLVGIAQACHGGSFRMQQRLHVRGGLQVEGCGESIAKGQDLARMRSWFPATAAKSCFSFSN